MIRTIHTIPSGKTIYCLGFGRVDADTLMFLHIYLCRHFSKVAERRACSRLKYLTFTVLLFFIMRTPARWPKCVVTHHLDLETLRSDGIPSLFSVFWGVGLLLACPCSPALRSLYSLLDWSTEARIRLKCGENMAKIQ